MGFIEWFTVIGGLLVVMALSNTVLKRLPLTTAALYLSIGMVLGPLGFGVEWFDPLEQSALLERITEIIVVISLFTAGLKLRLPLSDAQWGPPVRLAFISMSLTVGLVALVGVVGLGLPVGAAVVLGAVLAPTDPVLASDVQVEDSGDEDQLRFSLTGEAGLNDGTAFPFVMLGLGLLGLHELGSWGWRWLVVDVLWAVSAGIAIGAVLGTLTAHLVLYLRREHKEALGTDDFLALGLVALSYGAALLAHAYGFLAVFAAGLALRRVERQSSDVHPEEKEMVEVEAEAAGQAEDLATHGEHAPAYMTQAVLGFNEQLERIGQVGVVLMVGVMLFAGHLFSAALWFVPLFFLVIRPLSVGLGLLGADLPALHRRFIGWFGVRGIGSIYYLMYAVEHDLPEGLAAQLIGVVLTVVAVSVFAHGISVTPLMNFYKRRVEQAETEQAETAA